MPRLVHLILAFVFLLTACAPAAPAVTPTALPPTPVPPTAIPTATDTPVPPTETPTPLPSDTPTPSATPTITETPTPEVSPTWAVLRATVIPEKLSCRFGPGPDYLFKYALLARTRMDVLGRTEDGSWVLLLSRGDRNTNSCWANASLLEIEGDVMAAEPVDIHIRMPWSPYYPPLTGVSASRSGNIVTVFWNPLVLNAGDDSGQTPYIVEAWVCVDGEYGFTPIGSYNTVVEVRDDADCGQQGYARVLAAEKHGYTRWVEIPWP